MSDSIRESLAANVLRLGNEVRLLTLERDSLNAEVDRLINEKNQFKEQVRYLEIELNCETGRWEHTMEENARLRKEIERLTEGSRS
jgi:DNA repair exonuclease SbcCD nuclease subunit